MVRFLLRMVGFLGSAAVGFVVGALLLDGFHLRASGLIATLIVFVVSLVGGPRIDGASSWLATTLVPMFLAVPVLMNWVDKRRADGVVA